MPILASLFFLILNASLAALAPQAEWVWVALISNAGSLGAFLALRNQLPAPLRLTATGLVMVFLLNYHMQIFLVDWLYYSTSFDALWRDFSLRRLDGSMSARAESIYLITTAFGLICAGLTACASFCRGGGLWQQQSGIAQVHQGQRASNTLWIIFAFGSGTALLGVLIQVTFGVGALTAERAFAGRWDGVFYHGLVTLTPLLFMAVHWESLRKGHTALARFSLLAYGGLAIVETAMMSSRGFVVLQMLPFVLLYLWMGYPPRRLLSMGAATIALTLMLYPVMTTVRTLRSVSGYGAADSISTALSSSSNEGSDIAANLVRMSARFIGYTSYLTSLERPDTRFDWSYLDLDRIITLRENGFTRFFTEEIAGFGAGIRGHFSSPGLLGAAQIIGGPALVLAVPPLFALITMWTIRFLCRWKSRLGPLVPVNVLASLLFLFEEGVFDLIFTRLLLVTLALVLLNWLFHFSVPDEQGPATA